MDGSPGALTKTRSWPRNSSTAVTLSAVRCPKRRWLRAKSSPPTKSWAWSRRRSAVVRKKTEIDHSRCGKREKFKPDTAQADSHGAARSIQAWPRPLGSRSGDADEAAAAPAHLLADRVRLALTPYGAVLGCNRCSTSSRGFANGLHSAGSPSQDTRAVGSQSVAHKANLLSGSGKVFSALGAAGWRSTYRAPE